MTKNNYFFSLIVAIGVVLCAFGLLHYLKFILLPMQLFVLINVAIPILFLAGTAIVTIGKHKGPESFVQRFFLLTTFQILAVLAVIAGVWYVAVSNKDLMAFGLQFVSVFTVLMAVQSVLLIRLKKGG